MPPHVMELTDDELFFKHKHDRKFTVMLCLNR